MNNTNQQAESLCQTCQNGIWCESWGEMKCQVMQTVVMQPVVVACPVNKYRKGHNKKCKCIQCQMGGE